MEEDQREFNEIYEEEQDDLLDFLEDQEDQLNMRIMGAFHGQKEGEENKSHHGVEDDANFIQSQQGPKKEKKKDHVTEEQRKARELKILNSRKYFEIAKLMFLKKISEAFKESCRIKKQYKEIVARWISLLSPALAMKFLALKKRQPLSIKPLELLSLMKEAKQQNQLKKVQKQDYTAIFWSFCQYLGLSCRKIYFFGVQDIVEEVFFQLKFHASELQRKKNNNKSKQVQAFKIQLSQQMEKDLSSDEDSNKLLFLEDFQFDQASFKDHKKNKGKDKDKDKRESQPARIKSQDSAEMGDLEQRVLRRQHNFIRKKNFRTCYFQLFDPASGEWILLNSEIFQAQDCEQSKKIILQGKFVVSFFSLRLLHFKEAFKPYSSLRLFDSVVIQNLRNYFEDNHQQLNSRCRRLGIRWIMRKVFEQGAFSKNALFQKSSFMLNNYDSFLFEKNQQIQLEYQLTIFPKNKEEMLTSPFFVVQSLLPKYCILDANAKPLPDRQFSDEKVFLRRDVVAVTSRLMWVDRGRRVKPGQVPVKRTENKSKNITELFLYEQTMPFQLEIDPQNGGFVPDDEYNSIYVPSDFIVPTGMVIVKLKVSRVCKKAGFRHVKVMQGFSRSMGRVLPNEIGFLIYQNDKEDVERLYEQQKIKMEEGKAKNKIKELTGLWNKLFKKIELSDWTRSFNQKR